MIVFPNAKINLGLNVVSRRTDGYHNLETVFYPIPLCDVLEFLPAEKTSLQIVGKPVVGNVESNLVMRAYRLLAEKFALPNLAICLQKNIPMGAGLGGGSSDAAFMLRALNDTFALQITDDELEKMAATLGADCAFFIRNKAAFATGIGNQLTPSKLSLNGFYLVLVKPDIHISTAEAYSQIVPKMWEIPLSQLLAQPISAWRNTICNDFEPSCFAEHPLLAHIKQQLYTFGATYAAMSGSGSTIYGIFEQKPTFNLNEIDPASEKFVLKLN